MVRHGRRPNAESLSRARLEEAWAKLPDRHCSAREGRSGSDARRLAERGGASAIDAAAHPEATRKTSGLGSEMRIKIAGIGEPVLRNVARKLRPEEIGSDRIRELIGH